MPKFTQADRPITVTTPLGPDVLLLNGFSGHEGISQLFRFELDLLAEFGNDVRFESLLGQKLTIHLTLPDKKKRHFNGVCIRVSEGEQDAAKTFRDYRAEIVPSLWFLTRKAQSRIFQHMTVPDILKKVVTGFDVAWEISGKFEPRDFCVQYRETDFNFASRLMEEEGIFYFFEHANGKHTLILADDSSAYPACHGATTLPMRNGVSPSLLSTASAFAAARAGTARIIPTPRFNVRR